MQNSFENGGGSAHFHIVFISRQRINFIAQLFGLAATGSGLCTVQSAALELWSSSSLIAFLLTISKTLLTLPVFNENHNAWLPCLNKLEIRLKNYGLQLKFFLGYSTKVTRLSSLKQLSFSLKTIILCCKCHGNSPKKYESTAPPEILMNIWLGKPGQMGGGRWPNRRRRVRKL